MLLKLVELPTHTSETSFSTAKGENHNLPAYKDDPES